MHWERIGQYSDRKSVLTETLSIERPVFISYRREDEPGYALALYQVLEDRLGSEAIFKDIEGGFRDGDDFPDELARRVAECDVLLAVIGPKWAVVEDGNGSRRLNNPQDWVRVEIAAALSAGKRVIPVLVNNSPLPAARDLPQDIAALARKHARKLSNERFAAEARDFANSLADILEEIANAPELTPEPEPQQDQRSEPETVQERQLETEPELQTGPESDTEPKANPQSGEGSSPVSGTRIRLGRRSWLFFWLFAVPALLAAAAALFLGVADPCDQLTPNSSIEEVLQCQQR